MQTIYTHLHINVMAILRATAILTVRFEALLKCWCVNIQQSTAVLDSNLSNGISCFCFLYSLMKMIKEKQKRLIVWQKLVEQRLNLFMCPLPLSMSVCCWLSWHCPQRPGTLRGELALMQGEQSWTHCCIRAWLLHTYPPHNIYRPPGEE